jgi:hypothetical protein
VPADAVWDVETTSGDVSLHVRPDTTARVELRTVSGDFHAPSDADDLLFTAADHAVELGVDPTALVSVHTTSGNLNIERTTGTLTP